MFNIVCVLSLLLCMVTAGLWVRSINHLGYIYWVSPTFTLECHDGGGMASIVLTRDHMLRPPVSGTSRIYGWFFESGRRAPRMLYFGHPSSPDFNRLGFGLHVAKTVGNPPQGYWAIGGRVLFIAYVPYWLLVTLTGIVPLNRCRIFLRRVRRRSSGRCPNCGYNLTDNTSGVCPECGTAVKV